MDIRYSLLGDDFQAPFGYREEVKETGPGCRPEARH
jgi:hypothetical protein